MQNLFQNAWFQLALKLAMTGGIVLFVIGLCGLFLAGLQRLFRVTVQRVHTLYLKNLGNVASVYHLTAESLEPSLKFQFFQNDIPLTEVEVAVEPQVVATIVQRPSIVPENNKPAATNAAPAKTLAAVNNTQPKMTAQGVGGAPGAGKAAEKVVAKSGALASLLGTVGGLLPGSLGKSLKEQSAMVRVAQSKTKDVAQKPQEMQRKLDQMQKDSGKLGVKTPNNAALPQSGQAAMPGPTQTTSLGQVQTTAVQPGTGSYTQAAVSAPVRSAAMQVKKFYRTSEVGPEETIQLTLQITPKSRIIPEGSFLYTIKSQQVQLEKFEKEIAPLSKQGVVYLNHIARWHYWLPNLISVFLVFAGLATIGYSIYRLWL
jgi:hypothetical protein